MRDITFVFVGIIMIALRVIVGLGSPVVTVIFVLALCSLVTWGLFWTVFLWAVLAWVSCILFSITFEVMKEH